MRKVNEMIIGRPLDDRTADLQATLMETYRDRIAEPEFVDLRILAESFNRTTSARKSPKKCIKNFGTGAATELIGNLGIWLSQLTDEQLEWLLEINRNRRKQTVVKA